LGGERDANRLECFANAVADYFNVQPNTIRHLSILCGADLYRQRLQEYPSQVSVPNEQAPMPERQLLRVDGLWSIDDTKATDVGPVRVNTPDRKIIGCSGLCLARRTFGSGQLSARATIRDTTAAARLVFGYNPETPKRSGMGAGEAEPGVLPPVAGGA
jgi:hypothetical protein